MVHLPPQPLEARHRPGLRAGVHPGAAAAVEGLADQLVEQPAGWLLHGQPSGALVCQDQGEKKPGLAELESSGDQKSFSL